jgi:hypothetical protein
VSARKTFLLRLSPRLYEELKSWAETELRSVNGQIEFLLQRAVQERRRRSAGSAASEAGPPGTGPPDDPS